MLLCGKKLTAEEAHSRGFVSEVFTSKTFAEETKNKLKHLANLPPEVKISLAVAPPNKDQWF